LYRRRHIPAGHLRDGEPADEAPPKVARQCLAVSSPEELARSVARKSLGRTSLEVAMPWDRRLRKSGGVDPHVVAGTVTQETAPGTKQPYEVGSASLPAGYYVSGVASHFGFVSRPHFFGSSLCIFSIAFAVSGCLSMTCLVMVFTISSQVDADSF
jgi:hypothetical protein